MKTILLLSLATLSLGLSSCATCCKPKAKDCCGEKSACCDKKPADGSKCESCDSKSKAKKM